MERSELRAILTAILHVGRTDGIEQCRNKADAILRINNLSTPEEVAAFQEQALRTQYPYMYKDLFTPDASQEYKDQE